MKDKPLKAILAADHFMEYNGIKIKWFIGDWNFDNRYWVAWGKCRGSALSACSKI